MKFLLSVLLFATALMASELQNISFQTNSGDTTSLAQFTGKVVLVVNTASKCGQTPQYAGLEKLYETYKDRGLVVVAFPSNDFSEQEPGTNAEIKEFCATTYGVTFPLMAKIPVLGENKHPLYRYLVEHSDPSEEIQWNFTKFLIDRSGNVVARFHYKMQPDDPAIVTHIEELLGAKPSE